MPKRDGAHEKIRKGNREKQASRFNLNHHAAGRCDRGENTTARDATGGDPETLPNTPTTSLTVVFYISLTQLVRMDLS